MQGVTSQHADIFITFFSITCNIFLFFFFVFCFFFVLKCQYTRTPILFPLNCDWHIVFALLHPCNILILHLRQYFFVFFFHLFRYYSTHMPCNILAYLRFQQSYNLPLSYSASSSSSSAVPPTRLTILDHHGAEIRDQLAGPYLEGDGVNLTCLSSGGVPPPRVSWWREHALVDDSFHVQPDGTVRNILHLKNIARKDLLTVSTSICTDVCAVVCVCEYLSECVCSCALLCR